MVFPNIQANRPSVCSNKSTQYKSTRSLTPFVCSCCRCCRRWFDLHCAVSLFYPTSCSQAVNMQTFHWELACALITGVLLRVGVYAAYSNPCLSDSESCLSGSSVDRCGYGSVCVGSSLETGSCHYLVGNLTCGQSCRPFNITHIAQLETCAEATFCNSANSVSYECTSVGTVRLMGCTCTSDSDCVSGFCSGGHCSVDGLSLGEHGFPCTDDLDCQSSNCTDSVCVGISEGKRCTNTRQCAYGLGCTGPSFVNLTCTPYIPIGGNCSSVAISLGRCVPHGYCDTVTNLCAPVLNVSIGSRCLNSNNCIRTAGCVNNVCTANGACSDHFGSIGCPYQMGCGCSSESTTPTCIGDPVTQECADLLAEYQACMYANQTNGPMNGVVPQNFWPVPDGCRCVFQKLYCSHTCPSPVLGVDYNLIDCCAGNWVPYSSSQNNSCYRDYCAQPHFQSSFMNGCTTDVCSSPTPTPTPADNNNTTAIVNAIVYPILGVFVVVGLIVLIASAATRSDTRSGRPSKPNKPKVKDYQKAPQTDDTETPTSQ